MRIETVKNGNEVTVKVFGRITTDNNDEFMGAVADLGYPDIDLTMDFSGLEYITSAGLRTLLIVRKKLSYEKMRIINVNSATMEIFDTAGFLSLIQISEKEEKVELGNDPSFKEVLSYRVKTTPDKDIFFIDDRAYNWKDVDDCSQIIADDLSKLGVHKGSHVGIMGRNGINWIFTFFAVQKLGGVVVLLNFSLSPNELVSASQIGDITHVCYGDINFPDGKESFVKDITGGESKIRYTYDISKSIDFSERYDELPELSGRFREIYDSDDPSVMIFTSGTTGKPKGVLSSSHDRISNCKIMYREMHSDENDRICMFLPLCHVFGFGTGLSVALLLNIPLYMPSKISDEALLDTIEKNRCTIFNSVPTKIISMAHNEQFSPERVASLRVSMIGGAAITAAQLEDLQARMPGVHFMPIYGMSEVSPISIVLYDDTPAHITGTVGKPVKEVEVEIRNPANNEACPVGVEGEITVKSATSLVCYYKLDLEKQALNEDGWIPTGDLGVIDEDGYLRISGRIKDLIIRGGENISPGEIATAITEFDGIADVKVVGVPDALLGETVAAAIVMKKGCEFDREAMDRHLAGRISKYKIPAHYEIYDAFPLLANGKVDMLTLKKEVAEKAKAEN